MAALEQKRSALTAKAAASAKKQNKNAQKKLADEQKAKHNADEALKRSTHK